ncbi:LysR family transcriptional regulator [Gordonia sp. NPDC003424]
MDVRQLKYFLAVVDEGSMNKAAETLLIAQPSLSQTIATLERELGVALFHRIGRRLVLTDAGTELIGPARIVLRDIDHAETSVRALKQLRAGRVDLITMPSPGIEPLTQILADFARAYPGVTVNAEAAFTPDDVLNAVRSGQCEVGLLGAATPVRASDLDTLDLGKQPLILICGHTDRELPAHVPPDDLAGLRLIVSQRGSLMRALVDDVLASGVDVTIAAEVAHRTSILPMILDGIGHAVMPSSWARLAERLGATVHHIIPETYLHVALVSRKGNLTPPARALVAAARTHLDTPPDQTIGSSSHTRRS